MKLYLKCIYLFYIRKVKNTLFLISVRNILTKFPIVKFVIINKIDKNN